MNVKELAERFERIKNRARRYSSLQITGNTEIIADGCLKIVSCDENAAMLVLLKNTLTVTGKNLKMKSYGQDGVMINGEIITLEFGDYNET